MVDNLQCSGGNKNHTITNLEYTPEVKQGDHYTIVAYTQRKWMSGRFQRLSLFDGSKLIADSGSITVASDETIKTVFTGVMPGKDMYLNLSLQSESFQIQESCQDSRDFIIRVSEVTVDIPSPEPPYVPPPTSEPWVLPWEEAGDSLDTLTTTIIIGVVGAVIIALIMKRK